jgi:DNA invertase Pin-like site-specific DNA recombinase
MKAVGYTRVVPGESADSALDHQKDRLKSYCELHHLRLEKIFSEKLSGDISLSEGRPALSQAISACHSGDKLVVIRLDRLSSKKKLVSEIFEQCQEKNIKIEAVSGPQSIQEMHDSLEVTVQLG